MVKYRHILFSLLLVGVLHTVEAKEDTILPAASVVDASEANGKTMTLNVTVNQKSEIKMEKVPTSGYLEVYNLLGRKVTSINLKTCVANSCSIDLAKGIYILKAGKIAKKIVVK